jgi:hypothetical protein
MKSILDSSFRYTPSFNTDLEKTFARMRSDHRKDAERAVLATGDALIKVSSTSESRRQAGDEVCVAARLLDNG